MPKQTVRAVTKPLRLLWRITGKPIHQRLFGRYFQATLSRLNSTLGELSDVRAELTEVRRELADQRAHQEEQRDELDRKMRLVIGTHWDTTALARRLATIEDRVTADGQFLKQTPPEDEGREIESSASREAAQTRTT